jgi:hypothetical protein
LRHAAQHQCDVHALPTRRHDRLVELCAGHTARKARGTLPTAKQPRYPSVQSPYCASALVQRRVGSTLRR